MYFTLTSFPFSSFRNGKTGNNWSEDAGSLGDESSSDEQLPGDADGLEGPTKKHQFNARI